MKQGNKYLFSNGRGNYSPCSLLERQYIKELKKKIEKQFRYCGRADNPIAQETNERVLDSYQKYINSHKHGMKSINKLRKGLNSKLRHLAKKEITKELNNI